MIDAYGWVLSYSVGLVTLAAAIYLWVLRHGAWIMGTGEDYAVAFNRYRLFEISSWAFTACPDLKLLTYSKESGGSEHCRAGAQTLWTADLFEWLATAQSGDPK